MGGRLRHAARTSPTLAVLLLQLSACVHAPIATAPQPPSNVAYGRQAMVATADERASAAGLRMLQAGGNAVDAFAAASFAISVVRPQSTGVGGGGFAVLHLHGGEVAVDFRERAPGAAKRDTFASLPADASLVGPFAVATPGLVAGVLEIQARYGRLPRAMVMEPAIALAEVGFPIYPGLAKALTLAQPALARFPESARIFLRNGRAPAAGDELRQMDLGRLLRAIAADGANAFYHGDVAAAVVDEVQRLGGVLRTDDLASYRVIDRPVVRGRYRDYDVVSMPPPSSGGVLLVEMLNMLAAAGPGAGESAPADRVHLLAEVMRRAYEDRSLYLGDPDFVAVPTERLLSPDYAAGRMRDFDPRRATAPAAQPPAEIRTTSTTHLSIIDAEGNVVAATETINGNFGSGVTVPGTGILLNNEMDDFATRPSVPNLYGLVGTEANAVGPRKTPLSSMTPSIVLRGGEPVLVAGGPGGPVIITSTLQTILNVVDRGMPLPEAVAAPRVHHQFQPNQLNYEPGAIDEAAAADLTARGHLLKQTLPMGNVQAVMRLPSGGLVGVSDPRAEGQPAGY